jgi:Tfp pilus assembly protein PilZ
MNIPAIKHQKYNIFLAKLFNLIIDLDEEQQQILLKEVEEKFLKEKRVYVRRAHRVPLRYINKFRIFSGFITNFSQDGCFIETAEPLFVGEEILMDIGLDSKIEENRIKGIVTHVNSLGIGIKYKEIINVNKGF